MHGIAIALVIVYVVAKNLELEYPGMCPKGCRKKTVLCCVKQTNKKLDPNARYRAGGAGLDAGLEIAAACMASVVREGKGRNVFQRVLVADQRQGHRVTGLTAVRGCTQGDVIYDAQEMMDCEKSVHKLHYTSFDVEGTGDFV